MHVQAKTASISLHEFEHFFLHWISPRVNQGPGQKDFIG